MGLGSIRPVASASQMINSRNQIIIDGAGQVFLKSNSNANGYNFFAEIISNVVGVNDIATQTVLGTKAAKNKMPKLKPASAW